MKNILNPARQPQKKGSSMKKTSGTKKKRFKEATNRRKALRMEPQPKYDVVSTLSNASSRLTFGQLWKREASSAKKELDQIFGKGRLMVAYMKAEASNSTTEDQKEEKCLAVALVQIHGTEAYVLLDTGATLNVTSPKLPRILV